MSKKSLWPTISFFAVVILLSSCNPASMAPDSLPPPVPSAPVPAPATLTPAPTPAPTPTSPQVPTPATAPKVSEPDPVVLASGEMLQSEKTRVQTPEVPEDDKTALAEGNGAFAFALYKQLKPGDGNLLFSPHSISTAIAMTYAGARGTTEKQMAEALHFGLPQQRLHRAFNWLAQELSARGKGASGVDGKGFRLNVVDAIWGQRNFHFRLAFLDSLAENYGAGLRVTDFREATEESRVNINHWVSDQTENKIKDLIPQGAIDPSTRLVLINTVYFNAAWQTPFPTWAGATRDLPFYLLSGENVSVPMMGQTTSFGYTDGEGYQAVELPYSGGELSMLILLPAKGKLAAFEDTLSFPQVDGIVSHLKKTLVSLTMPKFEFESPSVDLKKALSGLGMPAAFTLSEADFSGITGDAGLYISRVVHKAFVSVSEKGTEAGAATAGVMPPSAPAPSAISVTVDHPFIFLIRDVKTKAILFIGRVMSPVK